MKGATYAFTFAFMHIMMGSVLTLKCARNGQLVFALAMRIHMRPCSVMIVGKARQPFQIGRFNWRNSSAASYTLYLLGYCRLLGSPQERMLVRLSVMSVFSAWPSSSKLGKLGVNPLRTGVHSLEGRGGGGVQFVVEFLHRCRHPHIFAPPCISATQMMSSCLSLSVRMLLSSS